MRYFLGLDVSTTATKALLIDENGHQIGVASSAYDLATPKLLWAEQDPELWWRATQACVREVLDQAEISPDAVAAIGLTGQMHGLVALDGKGQVLRPAILWNDQRADEECVEMRRRFGLKRLVQITGNDAFPGFTAPKLLWMRANEQDLFQRIRQVLLPKDYVRYRLTGEFATDRAGAGGTLLLNLQTRDWSEELLASFEFPRSWFPKTHEGTEISGHLSVDGATLTGLVPGIPVVGGGGDQAAQAVGVGAVDPGILALTVGTSGVVFTPTANPLIEPSGRLHAFPHAVSERWHVMGVMLSAAGSLRWYRDVVAPQMPFSELIAEAADVEPGAEGLIFLPYLSGERTPHADPHARGAFVGLTLKHQRAHLTRAVLEGVAFGLRDNLHLIEAVGLGPMKQARLSGGGALSPVWKQMLADVLGFDLVSPLGAEGAALGAALLAGVGAGAWASPAEACVTIELAAPTLCRAAEHEKYDALYGRFNEHYPALRPIYHSQ